MKSIIKYILLTFLFSWTAWGLQYLGQEAVLPQWVQIFGMFGLLGPLFAFLILKYQEGLRFIEIMKEQFQKAPIWTIIFVMVSPFFLSGISYLVYKNFENGSIEPIGVTIGSFLPTALMILFIGGPIEEFGWRGFLLPQLRKRYSFIVTIILLGLIHGVWHLPLHFLNGTVQQAIPIYEFLIVTVAITVSYVFVYEFTKSIIPFILLHWFANLSSAIFPYYYNVEGRYALLFTTLLLDIILVILYYKRYHKKAFV